MRRAALLLLVAVLLAGCTLPAPDNGGAAPRTEATGSDVDGVPARDVAPPLALAIGIPDRWVPPRVNVTVTADAPPGATLDWYLANRNPPAPGQPDPLDRFEVRDTGDLEPGAPGRVVPVEAVGRYVFRVPGADSAVLNVSVLPGEPGLGLIEVALVDDAGWRFAPADLEVAAGARLAFRNVGNGTASAILTDWQRPLAWRSAIATFRTPTLLGDYDVVLVGHGRDGGRGEVTTRIIVDNRIPEPQVTFGPYEGELDRAGAPAPLVASRSHGFEPRHNLTDVRVRWNATSEAPFGASVRVTLEQDGRVVARGPFAASGELNATRLVAGNARVLVEAGDGVDVAYRIEVAALRVLETPESFFNRD